MNTLPRLSDLTTAIRHTNSQQDLVQYLSCLAFQSSPIGAYELFRERWPNTDPLRLKTVRDAACLWPVELMTKAAVAPGTTTDAAWAGALVQPSLFDGFLASVREQSILSTLPVTPVAFNQKVPKRQTGATFAWIGQNTPKKAGKMAFTGPVVPFTKAAGIVAFTSELMKLAQPNSEQMIYRSLVSDCVAFTDSLFLSTTAAVANVSPGGILNGVVAITAGATPDDTLAKLISTFFAALPTASAPTLIMSPGSASAFTALKTAPGPGIPDVVVTPHAGNHVIITDAAMIAVADGAVALDVSKDADVQLDDAPASPPTAATVLTSLWQANLVGVRTERAINWDASLAGTQYFDLVAA